MNSITLIPTALVAIPAQGDAVPPGLYHWPSQVCTLAAGMIQGAREQYGEPVTAVRNTCLDVEDHGTFQCAFLRAVEGG